MTITTFAIVNGVLAVLVLTALAAVMTLGFRVDRTTNASSVVPAGPTPADLHADDLAEAA